MEKKVLLYSRELSDTYALKTLEDYVTKNNTDINFVFNADKSSREKEVIGNSHYAEFSYLYDLALIPLSDLLVASSRIPSKKILGIDTALLKNCAEPIDHNKRKELRTQYDMQSELPIITIGYAHDDLDNVERIVSKFHKKSKIVVVDSYRKQFDHPVRAVEEVGALKDYYAMSDLNLSGKHFSKYKESLNNFVESTEGGPFYIIKPKKTGQYGYKELVSSGNIKEFHFLSYLIRDIEKYIKNFNPDITLKHHQSHSLHISQTRSEYLPQILDIITSLANGQNPSPLKHSNLKLRHKKDYIEILHKDTTDFIKG